jgi:hypothetical protein
MKTSGTEEIGATDDARYITGQTLGVDGGLFLHA